MMSFRLLSAGLVACLAVSVVGADEVRTTPPSDKDLVATVDARVKERQPTTAERAFDAVGWARTIVEAQKLAREHQRPVFLFTHDGRMNLGRC